jgi:SAM-dependent methyltransferase
MWEINRSGWDKVAHIFYGVAALPNYGPLTPTEEDLKLLGDMQHKTVLEIGCGSGHSLLYLAQHGAAEVWGVDLSAKQIEFARALLLENDVSAHLLNAPMETNPGLPESYFDFAISIYSLGWTTDLGKTLALVYSYLKPGGFYLFSWEHPFYSCLDYQSGAYVVKERYREHTFVEDNWNEVPIVMHQRKLSTFINTALEAGFQIECLIESEVNLALAQESDYAPESWYSVPRATLVPPTFILKIRKPRG